LCYIRQNRSIVTAAVFVELEIPFVYNHTSSNLHKLLTNDVTNVNNTGQNVKACLQQFSLERMYLTKKKKIVVGRKFIQTASAHRSPQCRLRNGAFWEGAICDRASMMQMVAFTMLSGIM